MERLNKFFSSLLFMPLIIIIAVILPFIALIKPKLIDVDGWHYNISWGKNK